MSATAERVDNQRCIYCNGEMVDAWVCGGCAMSWSSGPAEEQRAPTWTEVSRSHQRFVDRSAAHEQLIQIQTVCDHDTYFTQRAPSRRRTDETFPVDSEARRSSKIRKMLRDATHVGALKINMEPIRVLHKNPFYEVNPNKFHRLQHLKNLGEKKMARMSPEETVLNLVRKHGHETIQKWVEDSALIVMQEQEEMEKAEREAKRKELLAKIEAGKKAEEELRALSS